MKHPGAPSKPSHHHWTPLTHPSQCHAEQKNQPAKPWPNSNPQNWDVAWCCFKAKSFGVVCCIALGNQNNKISNDFHRIPVRFLLMIKSVKVTKVLQRQHRSVYFGWCWWHAVSPSQYIYTSVWLFRVVKFIFLWVLHSIVMLPIPQNGTMALFLYMDE